MNPVYIVVVVILGTVIPILLFVIIKSTFSPKRPDAIPRLIRQGKTQAAVKLSKQILAKEPKNYLAHYYMGRAYLADNKPELAIMEFKLVNENALFGKDISELEFRKLFSELLLKFNQTQEALREYVLLTKLEPVNAENYYHAGHLYEEINRYDLALGYMQKCVKINPRHAKAHAEIGLMMYRTKQLNEAKREIDTALKLSPETYSTYYYLGKILKEAKDIPGAIKAFERAQRDPEYKTKSIIERGACYMMVNRTDNAIPDFQRAIELDKTGTSSETLYARYFLASCYEKIRQIDKAIEQWDLIYKRDKSFRDVATKLTEYKDLQSNDYLKDYLTSSDDEFLEICKIAANKSLKVKVIDSNISKWGCQITGVDQKSEGMMSVRKQIIFIRFYREPAPIEEAHIHSTLDEMKKVNSVNGYILSSSGFTNTAKRYAEGRPVVLVDKEKLEQILTKSGS